MLLPLVRTLPANAENVKTRPNREKKVERKQEVHDDKGTLNTYTTEEMLRIQRAIAMKEDVRALAKELGRSYNSLYLKIRRIHLQSTRTTVMKRGKYSAEEVTRIRLGVKNNEEFKVVAKELNRDPELVKQQMYIIANDPNYGTGQAKKSFSVQEDLLILDEVILGMDVTKLSYVGTFPLSIATKVAKEIARPLKSIRYRWNDKILPCLLQHYSGTTGYRVERMLTSLIAEKFSDSKGIDWSEIVNQHPEFVGHTATSLSNIFHKVHAHARAAKGGDPVSLQEVADYASAAYQPGREKKEPTAKAAHREAIISHFKKRIVELRINVVL